MLTMCTQDGGMMQMTFQLAAVNKALGSVSQIVANGNQVVFDPMGSYIENVKTTEKLWLREHNGVYVLDVMIAPPPGYPREPETATGFPRPGNRA